MLLTVSGKRVTVNMLISATLEVPSISRIDLMMAASATYSSMACLPSVRASGDKEGML